MKPNYTYNAEILRIVDGDTIEVMVSLGFNSYHKTTLRLLNFNAPEIRTRDFQEKLLGIKYANHVNHLFSENRQVTIRTKKTGSFKRWLAEVYLQDGRELGEVLKGLQWNLNTTENK